MTYNRNNKSRRNTAIIWSVSLLCYTVALAAVWNLDFIRYSRYSMEEAQKAVQEISEEQRQAIKEEAHRKLKNAPAAELEKIRDRTRKKKEKEIRKKLAEVEETMQKMEERKEELKEIYKELRNEKKEAVERLTDIAQKLANEHDSAQPILENEVLAEQIQYEAGKLEEWTELPDELIRMLEQMQKNSELFRANPYQYMDVFRDPAISIWQSMELERMIQAILNNDYSGVYDIAVMNTPPAMPQEGASLQQLKNYMTGMEEQLDTKFAELNAYQNAIRSMDSINENMDQSSMEHFSRDLAQPDKKDTSPELIEAQAKRLIDSARETGKETERMIDSREKLLYSVESGIPGFLNQPEQQADLRKLKENRETNAHALEQAEKAYESIRNELEEENTQDAMQDLEFLKTASRDVNGIQQDFYGIEDYSRELIMMSYRSLHKASDSTDEIRKILGEWIDSDEEEYAEIKEAARSLIEDAEQALTDVQTTVFDDEFATWERTRYIQKLLESLQKQSMNNRQGIQGTQGAQNGGQKNAQGGQQGNQQGQYMTKEDLMRMIEQMEGLQDAADSLDSKANSLARMSGINLPMSAQRLFTALQNRALKNRQGGQQGGQQGQGMSLQDAMRMLGIMGKDGVARAGQQNGQQGQGQGQGQQGHRNGYGGVNGRESGLEGDFDFQFHGHGFGRVGNSDDKRVATDAAAYAMIAESVPGRRITKDAAQNGFVYLDSWYVIGPWETNGKLLSERVKQEPETLIDLDAEYAGKTDPETGKPIRLKWRYVQSDTPCIRPPDKMENSFYYAYTDVYFEEDTDVMALVGTDDASVLWLNGEQVWMDDQLSTWALTEEIMHLHFKKGWNTLLYCIQNGPSECQFSLMMVKEDAIKRVNNGNTIPNGRITRPSGRGIFLQSMLLLP